MWFPNRSDTNQAVQSQNRLKKEEEVYCPCSENKGADQLHASFLYEKTNNLFMQIVGFLI